MVVLGENGRTFKHTYVYIVFFSRSRCRIIYDFRLEVNGFQSYVMPRTRSKNSVQLYLYEHFRNLSCKSEIVNNIFL